jgi:hypothetical protein
LGFATHFFPGANPAKIDIGKVSRGSSSTIVALSGQFDRVRRRNHSAQWAPSNPLIRTWENSACHACAVAIDVGRFRREVQNRIFLTAR